MKGSILTRLDRYSDAEKVFIQMIKKHPELSEPFNNLAVVYAAQGKYLEAEEALRSAIDKYPGYATAHENLGDIYAKMARRAYKQARELGKALVTSNNISRERLSLVNDDLRSKVDLSSDTLASVPAKTACYTYGLISNLKELALLSEWFDERGILYKLRQIDEQGKQLFLVYLAPQESRALTEAILKDLE